MRIIIPSRSKESIRLLGILLNIGIISSFRWQASRLRAYLRIVNTAGLGILTVYVIYVNIAIKKKLIAHVR